MIRRRTDRASVLSGRALPATGRAIALKTGTVGARSDRTTEPAPNGNGRTTVVTTSTIGMSGVGTTDGAVAAAPDTAGERRLNTQQVVFFLCP